jgi:anti-sigma factor RsiW
MTDGHGRYEELAVGHVLGGLTAKQSADFRSHLHTCPQCRSRVAELHGIADDLTAAARDERARTPVRTEVTQRAEPEPGPPRPPRIGMVHVTAAVVVVLALATAMAFWNLHLRSSASAYLGVAEAQGDALARLATGVELSPEFAPGVQGRVVTDGTAVTLTLAGVEALDDGERLVAWFDGAPDPTTTPPRVLAGPGELLDGTIATSLEIGAATTMQVTREIGISQGEPQGPVVLDVTLVVERSG